MCEALLENEFVIPDIFFTLALEKNSGMTNLASALP
jgi:hypothetical protein